MTHQMSSTRSWRSAASALLPVATAALATGIFVAEAITSMKLAVAVFYVLVVLLAARFSSARGIVLAGAGCVGLTLLAFFLPGFSETEAGGVGSKHSISAAVIGLTTFLVTEQQRATEALRESEEQWREVFEHNPVMYFMVSPTGTVLSVNAFGAAQLGYTAAELIGQSVLSVFFEEDRELVKSQLATCVQNSAVRIAGRSAKSARTARSIWVRENAKAVRRSGNDAIVLIACEDITERRRAEQRARRAACRHARPGRGRQPRRRRSAYPSGDRREPGMGLGRSLEFRLGARQRVSRSAAIACGMRRISRPQNSTRSAASGSSRLGEGRLGQVWRSAKPIWMADATTEPEFLRASAAAKAGLHGGVIFPILLDTEALGVVEFFSRAARERDEEQLATLSAIGSQIGQFIKRKRAEAALRASEERWRRLFETSSAGMALFRLDGVCTAANPALQRMLGLSEEEIVGHNVLELNHHDERAATAEALAQYRGGSLTERQR